MRVHPAILATTLVLVPLEAEACRTFDEPTLADVAFADLAVVGTIADSRIVLNEAERDRMKIDPATITKLLEPSSP